jgi:hypothetical protein
MNSGGTERKANAEEGRLEEVQLLRGPGADAEAEEQELPEVRPRRLHGRPQGPLDVRQVRLHGEAIKIFSFLKK